MTDSQESAPIPMILHCPECRTRHLDVGEFATKPHHTHACQRCGFVWRPAVVATVGVQFLPGFKNLDSQESRAAMALKAVNAIRCPICTLAPGTSCNAVDGAHESRILAYQGR